MKHAFIVIAILALCATSAFAADFAPTKLVISASAAVSYQFDGSALEIPVSVSGSNALANFFVYTKDQAATIPLTKNGYLGWHWVNKIDTCMYMSAEMQLSTGSNTVTWDGKDNDGNAVEAGEYTYYIWGYDNTSARIPAIDNTKTEGGLNIRPNAQTQILEIDEAGNALANPVFVDTYRRWTIGNDPADPSLLETCAVTRPAGWNGKSHYAVDQGDWSTIYTPSHNPDAIAGALLSFTWVPNGEAVLNTDWGEDGMVTWSQAQFYHMNSVTDGNYVYTTSNTYKEDYAHNELWVVDPAEGELINEFDISEAWGDPADLEAGGQMNGGVGTMSGRGDLLFLGCHCSCLRQVLNPSRGLDDEDALVVYVNDNGDYVLDHNFEEDSSAPWVCNHFNVGPYTYSFNGDANGFALCPAYDMGAVSFGALAPDGTGIGYRAFAGETADWKLGINICDNGSAFDGYYSTIAQNNAEGGLGTLDGTWWSGQDSIMGVISTGVAVDDAPAAFAVGQNSPNPFNPTTTIGFSVPEAGTVSVDVFNVAGQKVDTIASEFMGAGSHSVTWDANGFSAGVYFYTVKTGDFTKTMKMTLVK
ncbi:T9SS type A sorting domain-containing protein [Candidatus Latescibacterota bacterium]